jgi:tellurite resistance protein
MVSAAPSRYSNEQIASWLRGLLSIAWSDGDYTAEEQESIARFAHELHLDDDHVLYQSIAPEELAEIFANDPETAENFLRTAVIVAIADGIYSPPEATLLHRFSDAFGLKIDALEALEHTLCQPPEIATETTKSDFITPEPPQADLLHPLKDWLDDLEMHDPRLARFICKMVPPQCPFERDIVLFGRKIVHIPPLCKLNPLYEQLVGLRFRALSYLADDCQEDISEYI